MSEERPPDAQPVQNTPTSSQQQAEPTYAEQAAAQGQIDKPLEMPSDVEPKAEPATEPADGHTPPLDDIEDAKYLAEGDPRRQEVEQYKEQAQAEEA